MCDIAYNRLISSDYTGSIHITARSQGKPENKAYDEMGNSKNFKKPKPKHDAVDDGTIRISKTHLYLAIGFVILAFVAISVDKNHVIKST